MGRKSHTWAPLIYGIPPLLQLPTYKWRSTGPGRSWCLLSITGLAALDGQCHSLSGTNFSASSRVTCLLPATQAGSHAGPKVYIWNVFGSSPLRPFPFVVGVDSWLFRTPCTMFFFEYSLSLLQSLLPADSISMCNDDINVYSPPQSFPS